MTSLDSVMSRIRMRYADAGIEDPAAEARILVGGLLGLERIDFVARGDRQIDPAEEARIEAAVGRRLAGEPPYRILGQRPFFGIDLALSAGTLEPRPDTEILVTAVLERLQEHRDAPLRILDLGTGTGAICLALLSALPHAIGLGSDISEDALATARANAERNGFATRFRTQSSRWFQNITGRFDVIVSNPPYIASDVIPSLAHEVSEFDPLLALDGGTDGLDAYREIAEGAAGYLDEVGIVAVETGFDQRDSVETLFVDRGFVLVDARKDYGGNDRVQIFRTTT